MRYQVLVEFNQDFLEINDSVIRIGIRSKPTKGQANIELIKKIAKHFGVSSNEVKIISGFKSKTKNIEINSEK